MSEQDLPPIEPGKGRLAYDKQRRTIVSEPFTADGYVAPLTDSSKWKAKNIWVDIEHLLINECGLPEDCGLTHQRPNIQNIIEVAISDALIEERQKAYARGLADGRSLL